MSPKCGHSLRASPDTAGASSCAQLSSKMHSFCLFIARSLGTHYAPLGMAPPLQVDLVAAANLAAIEPFSLPSSLPSSFSDIARPAPSRLHLHAHGILVGAAPLIWVTSTRTGRANAAKAASGTTGKPVAIWTSAGTMSRAVRSVEGGDAEASPDEATRTADSAATGKVNALAVGRLGRGAVDERVPRRRTAAVGVAAPVAGPVLFLALRGAQVSGNGTESAEEGEHGENEHCWLVGWVCLADRTVWQALCVDTASTSVLADNKACCCFRMRNFRFQKGAVVMDIWCFIESHSRGSQRQPICSRNRCYGGGRRGLPV